MVRKWSVCVKVACVITVTALAGILLPLQTRSEVHIKPFLVAEEQLSDNFYRGENNEATVWVTRLSPGISLDAYTDRSRLIFDYSPSFYWHRDNEDNLDASRDNYTGHDLYLFAATRLFTRLTIGLDEDFILTREPASSDRFSQAVERDKYWRNRIAPFLTYDLAEKGEIRLGYRHESLEFIETRTPRENSMEHRGILTLTYHLNSTNHLDLENQFWTRQYDGPSSAYDSYQAKLIYRRELTDYLKAEIGAGYHHRWFDNDQLEDKGGPVFHGGITGATDITKINFFVERNINDFTQGNDYFSALRANLFMERLFIERIRAYLGGYYQNSDYVFTPREDDTWNVLAGLGYRFLENILEVSAEYNYTNRDSNETGRSYEENRIFLRLTAAHDFGDEEI
jgi:hypothetical protein